MHAALLLLVLGAEPEPFDPATMKVREVPDTGHRLTDRSGGEPAPLALRSQADVEKHIPTKPAQDALMKGVDFRKEYLVVIVWYGSGGDRLAHKVQTGKKGHQVVFTHTTGGRDDKCRHQKVFVLPRTLPFRMEK